MNVAFLINNYFKGQDNVSIDIFDAQSLNGVYQDVMHTMTSHLEIETSVLQALSYCFYEMLDNVHIHSGRPIGTAMTRFDPSKDTLQVLIADDGKGIRQSLAENPKSEEITESEALRLCLQDSITDGKGMGSGLYATSRLIDREKLGRFSDTVALSESKSHPGFSSLFLMVSSFLEEMPVEESANEQIAHLNAENLLTYHKDKQ